MLDKIRKLSHQYNKIEEKMSHHDYYKPPTYDIEYEICRNLISHARDSIAATELQLMMHSNELLDTLSQSVNKKNSHDVSKDYSLWGTSRTLDTLMTEEDEEPRAKMRPFARKTNKIVQLNTRLAGMDQNLSNALSDIKENCSRKTYENVNALLENYNSLRQSLAQGKAQEHNAKAGLARRGLDTERGNTDHTLMMAAKTVKLEKQNSELANKIKQLQTKIQQLQSENKVKNTPIIENKQAQKARITDFTAQIQMISNKITSSLQTQFIDKGCNRCCELIKKVKTSLIDYKQLLSAQIEFLASQPRLSLNEQVVSS